MIKNLSPVQETWVEPWVRKIPWRREWLLTPVFWPGEFHGHIVHGGHKESDTTKRLSLSLMFLIISCLNIHKKKLQPNECLYLKLHIQSKFPESLLFKVSDGHRIKFW